MALVMAKFTCRACVPAFVNPEPLIRVGADHALKGGGKVRCVDFDVALLVARADKFDRRVAVKKVTPTLFVPDSAGRNNYGVGAQGEQGRTGCRASQMAEEGDEDAFFRLCVEVGENAECAASAQGA